MASVSNFDTAAIILIYTSANNKNNVSEKLTVVVDVGKQRKKVVDEELEVGVLDVVAHQRKDPTHWKFQVIAIMSFNT